MEDKIAVFKLLDRQPISHSRHENDSSLALDFPVWAGVKNPYYIINNKGVRVYKRYIKGASTLNMSEQEKNGEKFNVNTDTVGFRSGIDIVIREDFDPLLVEFLRGCPLNTASSNHIKGQHKELFTEYSHEKESQEAFDAADTEDKALEELKVLKDTPEKMKNVAIMFGINPMLDVMGLYLELRAFVKKEPAKFLTSIANRSNNLTVIINKALQYGVIKRLTSGYSLGKGVFLRVSDPKESENMRMLFEYLVSDEGTDVYNEVILKNQQYEESI